MSKKKKNKKARQQAAKLSKKIKAVITPPPEPLELKVRRISDKVLDRMLEEYMLDALDSIGAFHMKVESSLGAKIARYEDTVRVQTSTSDHSAYRAAAAALHLAGWHRECAKHGLNAKLIMDIVQDGTSITALTQRYQLSRLLVRAHIRACLALWAYRDHRCSVVEFHKHLAGKNELERPKVDQLTR